MSLITNFTGRVKNTSLSTSTPLLPLFEAIVNAIHACEDKYHNMEEASIQIEILRNPYHEQASLIGNDDKKSGPEALPTIHSFKITDNGIGFTDDNMNSFRTLDTDFKKEKGCKGVGRLYWLKAFEKVTVSSYYQEQGQNCHRNIEFTVDGVQDKNTPSNTNMFKTMVHLVNFKDSYCINCPKKSEKIAEYILEHCLWYFIREGGCPKIILKDGEVIIDLDAVFNNMVLEEIKHQTVDILGNDFNCTFMKARSNISKEHIVFYCAASRVVQTDNINGKIAGLHKSISDAKGKFTYLCFVMSDLLEEKVLQDRSSFNITEKRTKKAKVTPTLDKSIPLQEVFFEDIREKLYSIIKENLNSELESNISKGRERMEDFTSNIAPKYKPLLKYLDGDINPDISDKDLDTECNKRMYELERSLLIEGNTLKEVKSPESFENYHERLQKYLEKVCDLNKSSLANYVSHRKVVLDFLESVITSTDGKYEKEDVIHKLILPMRCTSDNILGDTNLWLLDERLAFHNYLSSDTTLKSMNILETENNERPDIMSLGVYDNPLLINDKADPPLASITVVELKRPMRDDYYEDKNPIDQVLGYVDKIRNGKVKTITGRPIPRSSEVPAYCYIVADMTETLINQAKLAGLQHTYDYSSYFGYNPSYKAYIEIIGYDGMVKAAKERNRAFFDKLGLPSG